MNVRRALWVVAALLARSPAQEPDESSAPPVVEREERESLPVVPLPADAKVPDVRFVALAHERDPAAPGAHDRQATIWDVPVDGRAARRAVLGRSGWNATPLLDSARLLRWQVVEQGRRTVRLLAVDYDTFSIVEVLQASLLQAIGRSGARVYLTTDDGQWVLDTDSGERTALAPRIGVLAREGDDWLVAVDGRLARFDAARGEVVRRYREIAFDGDAPVRGRVIWDGGRWAVRRGGYFDGPRGERVDALPFGEWHSVWHELCVWDLDDGVECRLRTRISACGGSGEGVIPMELKTQLVGGMFRFTECRPETEARPDPAGFTWRDDVQWVTVDVATTKELLRERYRERDLGERDPLVVQGVPDYLREAVRESPLRAWGVEQCMAHAFLVLANVPFELPQSGARRFDAVCRTPARDRLLVLHGGRFVLCDLEQRTVQQWDAPDELAGVPVELHAVSMR